MNWYPFEPMFSVEKMTLESPGDIVIYGSRLNAKDCLLILSVGLVTWWGAVRLASASDIKDVKDSIKANADQITALVDSQRITEERVKKQEEWAAQERRRQLERTVIELQIKRCGAKQPLRSVFARQYDEAWAAYRELPNADPKFEPPNCSEM